LKIGGLHLLQLPHVQIAQYCFLPKWGCSELLISQFGKGRAPYTKKDICWKLSCESVWEGMLCHFEPG